ncbi:MAG: MFS transporter [Negativicutes bacterium]|nr:MFS transporter [Negativicutes bacterium]
MKRTNYRWMLAIFAMLMTFMSYMDRVNLSVTAPAIMQEFHFTKIEIGLMQTVFFVFYALCMVPSGTLTEWLGHRKVLPFALSWWSVFTALTAVCQQFWTWIVVRALFGMGEAPVFPACNAAFSKWFPKHERAKAVGFMLMGSHSGPIVGMPLAVFIMVNWGWRPVFITFGLLGLLVAFGYWLLIRNNPSESPLINDAEVQYIADGIEYSTDDKKLMPPWKDFFSSYQFWAIGLQLGVANYVNYMFVSWLPLYLLEARHFALKEMGYAAALPSFGIVVGNWFCAFVSDYLVRKGVSKNKIRPRFAAAGMLICCVGLYYASINTDKWMTVMWLTFALAGLGFNMNSAWTSCTDLAGRFAGTVSGWMNFCGNLIGATAPPITALVVEYYGWDSAIFVTGLVAILGAVVWQFVKPDKPLKHRYLTES